MGMVLIIWDRLFGTFSAEHPDETPKYGLTKPLEDPHHPVKVLFHEWNAIGRDLKRDINFKQKLGYLFNPPGWSHDGSSMTSDQLRTKWKEQQDETISAVSTSASADL
jgi:hypothetical protein